MKNSGTGISLRLNIFAQKKIPVNRMTWRRRIKNFGALADMGGLQWGAPSKKPAGGSISPRIDAPSPPAVSRVNMFYR